MSLTPEQFNKLSTKKDLEDLEKRLKEKFASKNDVQKILNAVCGIADNHKKFDEEMTANQGAHDRFEKRITNLETISIV